MLVFGKGALKIFSLFLWPLKNTLVISCQQAKKESPRESPRPSSSRTLAFSHVVCGISGTDKEGIW